MFVHTFYRVELRSLAVTDSDGSCFVEQQCVDIACRFYCLTGLGDDVGTEGTVHSGNADSREQSTDSRWYQTHEQR